MAHLSPPVVAAEGTDDSAMCSPRDSCDSSPGARLFLHGRNSARSMWGTSIKSETPLMRTTAIIENLSPETYGDFGDATEISFYGDESDTDDELFGSYVIPVRSHSLLSSDDEGDSDDGALGMGLELLGGDSLKRKRKKLREVGHFVLGPKLGEGAYATVKEGMDQETLRIVAVKVLDLRRLRKIRGGAQNLEREIEVQRALKKHKNIIELIEVIEDKEKAKSYIFLEMANGCTVQELLDAAPKGRLPECQVKFLLKQMLQGMIYMHGRNVVHRDIKPSNLMLTASSVLKISDFGVAEFLNAYQEGDSVTRTAGSPAFQSPEIANGDPGYSGIKVDVWASGVTLFYLLTGDIPFKGNNFVELFDNISRGEFTFPGTVSRGARDLINGMLEVDWKERLSPQDVLRHSWLREDPEETSREDWVKVPCRKFRIMDTLKEWFRDNEELGTPRDMSNEEALEEIADEIKWTRYMESIPDEEVTSEPTTVNGAAAVRSGSSQARGSAERNVHGSNIARETRDKAIVADELAAFSVAPKERKVADASLNGKAFRAVQYVSDQSEMTRTGVKKEDVGNEVATVEAELNSLLAEGSALDLSAAVNMEDVGDDRATIPSKPCVVEEAAWANGELVEERRSVAVGDSQDKSSSCVIT